MLYFWHELSHAAISPMRMAADYGRVFWSSPANPLSDTAYGRSVAASLELFERVTRRYGKPEFGIKGVDIAGKTVKVEQQTIFSKPFCHLLRFKKPDVSDQPKLLIVAPMSGHYASLLRGTVETMLADFDVYITDWVDARTVPVSLGGFDLDDFIDYIIEFLHVTGPETRIMAVCQPSVPVLAAVSLMEESADDLAPSAMCLMGGPVDTRQNPTAVNKLAEDRGINWFASNVIVKVPFPHAGFMRDVYPGFLQLTGFMTMNLDRHVDAHKQLFWNMVKGDGDSADKHDRFYDEYLSVMDLTSEFYLQTIEEVFIKHSLATGKMMHRGKPVRLASIRKTGLMTVEGELDDITGIGQTRAAHDLCTNLPKAKKHHFEQKGVGHYGVFNGSRFRSSIAPEIVKFLK